MKLINFFKQLKRLKTEGLRPLLGVVCVVFLNRFGYMNMRLEFKKL